MTAILSNKLWYYWLLCAFNMTPENLKLQDFCGTHDLLNLIKEPTCFKGKNPTCIDLILTNQKQLFMKSRTLMTAISIFSTLSTSIMKLIYVKSNPKIKLYRGYKIWNNDSFQLNLESGLKNLTDLTYTSFEEVFFQNARLSCSDKKENFANQWKFFHT